MTESAPKKTTKKRPVKKTASVEVIPGLEKPTGFVMTGATYDFFKRAAQLYLPALGALYFTLSQLWGLPGATQVVGTVAAFNTFVGVTVGLSARNYNNSDAKYDGVVNVQQGESAKVMSFEVPGDPEELVDKQDQILLKVNRKPL